MIHSAFTTWRIHASRLCRRSLACAAVSLTLIDPTYGAAPSETLGSYQRTAFTRSDGAPADIRSLAQTTDGFLWLAGTKGLTRFDGVQFTAFKPLQGENFTEAQLDGVFPAEGYGLWIANGAAGPTLLRDGHLTQFGEAQGYVGNSARFLSDPHGTVWSISDKAILFFKHGIWHVFQDDSRSDVRFQAGAFDESGNLWLAAAKRGLFVARRGFAPPVNVLNSVGDARRVTIGRSGRIYVTTADEGVHIFCSDNISLVEVAIPIPFFAASALEDRSGSLWFTSQSGNLYYTSPAALALAEKQHSVPQSEVVPNVDGFPWQILQDRVGNVWVGRNSGVDRFTPAAFTQVRLPEKAHELSASIDKSGGIWLGSENLNVMHLGANDFSWKKTKMSKFTLATYVDPSNDSVWAANPTGVWQLFPGEPHLVAPSPAPFVPYAIIRDRKKAIFVSWPNKGGGLMTWNGKYWLDLLKHPTFVKVMAVDKENNLWLGTTQKNSLIEFADGTEHVWTVRQGLDVGAVRSILSVDSLLWLGGDNGIQYFDGTRFVSIHGTNDDAFQNVTGLVQDGSGNLWVQNLDAILRIPAGELKKAMSAPDTRVTYRQFNTPDGVPGSIDADRMLPSLRIAADGRIWTHSSTGLAWLNPTAIPKPEPLPSIVVEMLKSGATVYPLAGSVTQTLSQDTFRIAYTVPALTHPDLVHFSYRLQGFSEWQDVGNRREAVFTKVPPGKYSFEVLASGEDGVASVRSKSLSLNRPPAWYQTWWFHLLAVLPLALMLWLAHTLRVSVINRRVKIRVEERERIARDLHDTLLQGLQGLQLRLQTWAADTKLEPLRRSEMSALEFTTRNMLVDGRDRIISLRRTGASQADLAPFLIAVGEEYASLYKPKFALIEHGESKPLLPDTASEVLDIVREGMRNAFVHADARSVDVTIDWRPAVLIVRVRDDGFGIDEMILRDGGLAGHWGVPGMRERAAKIGARMEIRRLDEGGTDLLLEVPARRAYARVPSRLWYSFRGSWGASFK